MKELVYPVLTKVLTGAVQLVVIVVCLYGITALNKVKVRLEAKMGKESFENIANFAKTLVIGVEQQFPQLAGEGKYNIVAQALNKKFGNKLSDDEINMFVEAAVGEMNLIKKAQQTTKTNNIEMTEGKNNEPKASTADTEPEQQEAATAASMQ